MRAVRVADEKAHKGRRLQRRRLREALTGGLF